MKKAIGLALTTLLLMSCANATAIPTNTQTVMGYKPPDDTTWISPGKVEVGNFHAGGTAEWPLVLHNGASYAVEAKKITTDAGETEAEIPVKRKPYATSGITFQSDIPETLKAIAVTETGIRIGGFTPGVTRTVSITYPYYSTFAVKARIPDESLSGYQPAPAAYQDWVIVADPTPVLAPRETRNIVVSLALPPDVKLPPDLKKWEFWITVVESGTTTNIQTELASRWLITMR
jgi:hypothetical protein